ncbi:hypothetical protein [Rhizobium laguerreae]|uniref:hypothetical protein n=1 Tax=Rhizobium laguerreae TaxID=1076926 RepID=UPI001C925F52|nr:hypothetical protein [Rhizobium laguerreae]MBY3124527.1 hypothetical protein [Rhizobium laguerreae]
MLDLISQLKEQGRRRTPTFWGATPQPSHKRLRTIGKKFVKFAILKSINKVQFETIVTASSFLLQHLTEIIKDTT